MDVVYYVRGGERNEELRWSLRSLANLPHDEVWIVGHTPSWVTGVRSVPGNRRATAAANAVGNLRLACALVTAERFVVFNDDFYVMEPLDAVPSWHAGPLAERAKGAPGAYGRQLRAALDVLRELGIAEPLAWTLHIPLVVERETLAGVLDQVAGSAIPPEWRTMYGNLSGATGAPADDVKVRRRSDPLPTGPFLSTADHSLPFVRRALASRFPSPSPYEVAA